MTAEAIEKGITHDQLRAAIGGLSMEVLERLAAGPLGEDDCRVCSVLKAIETPPARRLVDWHEFVLATPVLDDVLGRFDGPAAREWKATAGALSYTRCMVIYFAAAAELASRNHRALKAEF